MVGKLKWYQWLKKAEEQRLHEKEELENINRRFNDIITSAFAKGTARSLLYQMKRTRRQPANQRDIAIRREGRGW